ncbi:MAG: aminoacyl-histidine dipeptidase [Muribaculaceae bacterium]|nr:aminoacyl-histidine dipeptidase [Muribaculaceae bacterium]
MEMKNLKPALVWQIFDEINQVPRPSKKEGKIREWLVAFAQKHNLEYKVDEIGNVAMWRPAAPGFENAKKVVLQAHMDMVCEKVDGSNHNFDTDPIQTIVEGDWVRANGTTLGADDGMGMAGALACLIDPDLKVGPIQGLFTVDEETGLTGASNVGEGMVVGDYLLNMDSEDDGVITIGCAGGVDTLAIFNYTPQEAPKDMNYFKLRIAKLQGGHSGTDINLERGNATKFMVRMLWELGQKCCFKLADIQAGNLRNAIAHTAEAVVGVKPEDKETLAVVFNTVSAELKDEYRHNEKDMEITCVAVDAPDTVVECPVAQAVINAAFVVPHGVISMSLDVEGLTETSTNLASVKILEPGKIEVVTSQRSAVESRKYEIAHRIETLFKMAGGEVRHTDGYQGWAPNPESKLLKIAIDDWKKLYGVEPTVEAIHAGLECGLFLKVAPHMEMISYGPTLKDVHSPKERVHIPAVQKFWDFTVAMLHTIAEG